MNSTTDSSERSALTVDPNLMPLEEQPISGAKPRRDTDTARWFVRWVVAPVATILVSSFVIFAALSAAPGDPVTQLLGPHATPEQAAALRESLGLNGNVFQRYFDWLGAAIHGDFGQSITYHGASVSDLLAQRLGVTIALVIFAGVLVVTVGIGLGILAAVFRPLAPVVSIVTGIGIAVPSFVAALLLVSVFSLRLGWFPALGSGGGGLDGLWHLTLPAIALALGWSSYVTQITRASLFEERQREHVDTAYARGIPGGAIFRRHVLRNAAVPIITISGLTVAGLVAGAVVVETAFGLNGVGSFLVTSVQGKDYNVVEAISLLLVIIFVVATTLLDAVHVVLDPRLRKSGARR